MEKGRIGGAFYAEKETVRALYAVADDDDAVYAVALRGHAELQARYERIQAKFAAAMLRKQDAERQGRR